MRQTLALFSCSIIISLVFFWQTLFRGLLPISADALVGLYHPFRDYFSSTNPQGVAYKNFILTDPVLQQYPWKWLAIQGLTLSSLQNNPYNFSGTPLLANIQAGVFYPLNAIFFLGDFHWMWTIYIIFQPILAMAFMALYLRSLSLSHISSLFGGFVWAFSSFNLVWMEWGNIGHAGLWLPLVLLCVDKIAEKKEDIVIPAKAGIYSNRFRVKHGMTALFWHGVLQFSLMSSLFAGHFQVTFYLLVAMALYWFIRLGISKRSISLFTVHCLLFTVLTSIQWIPSLKLTIASNRNVEQENVLQREGFFIKPKQLVQIIIPDFFGNPSTLNYHGEWNYAEQIIYIGLIPLVFSILAIFYFVIPRLLALSKSKMVSVVEPVEGARNLFKYLYRSRIKSGMTGGTIEIFALLIISFGLLFSVDNPISRLPYQSKLPIFSDLQPTRLAYLITFGLSTLSAFGFNEFIKNPRKLLSKIFSVITIIFFILFIFLVISSKFSSEDKLISQRNLIFPAAILVFFSMVVGGLIFLKKTNLVRRINISLLIAHCSLLIVILDLFRFGWKFTPFSPKEYLYPITPAIKFLQDNMRESNRYMTVDRRILPPNANIMYKLKSIEGYDPMYSQKYARLITRMETGSPQDSPINFGRIIRPENFRSPIAKELGVKYILSLHEIKDDMLIKVFREGETRIYEIKGE